MNRYYFRIGPNSGSGSGPLYILEETTLENAIIKAWGEVIELKDDTDIRITKEGFNLIHVEYDVDIAKNPIQKESNE